jgi:hypothetical protein
LKLGIISDTHDNLPKIRLATEALNQRRVDLVVHAGDYIAPFSLVPLGGLNCDYVGVWGNNDGEKQGLAEKSGGRIKEPPLRLKLAGRDILVVHDIQKAGQIDCDILISGHTHKIDINRKGRLLMINPGECCGWLGGKATVAILDLRDLSVEVVTL